MANITHRVGIKAPIEKVYAALSTIDGIAGWWTQDVSGNSKVGGNIEFRFLTPEQKEVGKMSADVIALEPNKKVLWRFKTGPAEWIGTEAAFDLHQEGEYTIVLFGHNHWREVIEFTAHCSTKWAIFLISLKNLVETGKGKPSPNDIKIDNWN